jgi:hypothetical protein
MLSVLKEKEDLLKGLKSNEFSIHKTENSIKKYILENLVECEINSIEDIGDSVFMRDCGYDSKKEVEGRPYPTPIFGGINIEAIERLYEMDKQRILSNDTVYKLSTDLTVKDSLIVNSGDRNHAIIMKSEDDVTIVRFETVYGDTRNFTTYAVNVLFDTEKLENYLENE